MSSATCGKCGDDGFFERRKAACAGCGVIVYLCPACAPTYVACSDACRKRWREDAKTILAEPLSPSGEPRNRKPEDPGQMTLWPDA